VEKILVSACLLGAKVRYHGGDAACDHPILQRWFEEGRLVSVCPERDGGLPTPRPPAEIVGPNAGEGVVQRFAVVRTAAGADISDAFRRGAETALETAKRLGIRIAVLKEGSPSCGSSFVYDGTFSGTRVAGHGVTTALLESNGVRVFDEASIDAAYAWVETLERSGRLLR
jgi:uncharacterized protein YbbK (DUF523 family)